MKNSTLQKARANLVIDHPFFASLLLPMPLIESDMVPTFGTDGDKIWYNPEFMNKLSLREVTFVLAHEVMHCVFDHMGRRGDREMNRWNQAADYVINDILVKERVGDMPHGGLLNPGLVQKGNGTAEGVYNILPETDSDKKCGQSGGSMDTVFDAGSEGGEKKVDAATAAQKSADMKVRVIQARNAAKMQGALSNNIDRLVGELVRSVVDWKEVLRRFVSERAKVESTFARPKRRFLGEDLYLPSLSGQKMGALTVAVDCSGSVYPELLNMFASEINAIKEDTHPSKIEVIYFDSEVLHTETFEAEQEVRLSPRGGGGTAFSPVFEYINEQSELPACVVFLTDLYCDDFGPAPEYPVMWCALDKVDEHYSNVPFGEVVEVRGEN